MDRAGSETARASSSVCWSIPYEDLDVQDQVGGGGYSLVYRGLWKNTPVAVKKWFDPNMTDEVLQEFREEVMTHEALRHPNIVQFFGACMKLPNLCMVLEHMPHSLHSVLHQSNIELDRKRIVALATDISRAFIYLHSRRPAVIHRDVKPANFLVDRAWRVKVCDFGLASNSRKHLGAGTPAYMAPELFAGGSYNEKVDVYAFGVMLNEMECRQVPWKGVGLAEIKTGVLQGARPEVSLSSPKPLVALIQQCWAQEASCRPSFDAVLEMLKELAKQI